MGNNILLTEANYKDKYPPLGLMKIATYHRLKGDNVIYKRDFLNKDRNYFSKIYITTRFSFHWKKTEELIKYYQKNYNSEILVGGIHASINPEIYKKTFNLTPVVGSYKGEIDSLIPIIEQDEILNTILPDFRKYGIDVLPPDYSIFDGQELPFNDILRNNYLIRSTKGCTRNCNFCDVNKICEDYIDRLPIQPIINYIKNRHEEKKDILFFDDNTLISSNFHKIIEELIDVGFYRGAKLSRKIRACDFNQGIDLRLLTDEKLQLISSICLKPVRFAFDDINLSSLFKSKIKKVINSGLRNISVYVLYNYNDSPKDFYERLLISVMYNKDYNSRISSFPMKYIPNNQVNRKYIGRYWTKRKLRGVQCILNGCHGIVPVKYDYFVNAFGEDSSTFERIIIMPEKYIIKRKLNTDKIKQWEKDYNRMTPSTREAVMSEISANVIYELPNVQSYDSAGQTFLKHYLNEKY
ncbi:hypothetical protein EMN47_20115 [Prolixibacteraceae bacterium JC049]|nr:hypothetical protein [Prolixibacteraceae bacterium JC049]